MISEDGAYCHESYFVRSYETNLNGSVSVANIANYMQQSAAVHAGRLGFAYEDMVKENVAWTLISLSIRMERYPFMGKEVRIKTWNPPLEKLKAHRDFHIMDGEDRPIGKATTTWVVMDLATRRLTRIPDFVRDAFVETPHRALEEKVSSLPALAASQHEKVIFTRESDLDLNDHVNNVHMIEWAVETVPRELRRGLSVTELDVSFRSESRYNDIIFSRCAKDSDRLPGQVFHSLERYPDGLELARVRTKWEKI